MADTMRSFRSAINSFCAQQEEEEDLRVRHLDCSNALTSYLSIHATLHSYLIHKLLSQGTQLRACRSLIISIRRVVKRDVAALRESVDVVREAVRGIPVGCFSDLWTELVTCISKHHMRTMNSLWVQSRDQVDEIRSSRSSLLRSEAENLSLQMGTKERDKKIAALEASKVVLEEEVSRLTKKLQLAESGLLSLRSRFNELESQVVKSSGVLDDERRRREVAERDLGFERLERVRLEKESERLQQENEILRRRVETWAKRTDDVRHSASRMQKDVQETLQLWGVRVGEFRESIRQTLREFEDVRERRPVVTPELELRFQGLERERLSLAQELRTMTSENRRLSTDLAGSLRTNSSLLGMLHQRGGVE